jgi:hypothetical protein
VLDVLRFLALAMRFIDGLDDQRGSGRDHPDGGLATDDFNFDCDVKSFEFIYRLRDGLTDLPRLDTEGAKARRKLGGTPDSLTHTRRNVPEPFQSPPVDPHAPNPGSGRGRARVGGCGWIGRGDARAMSATAAVCSLCDRLFG